jgi:hypothetical protein
MILTLMALASLCARGSQASIPGGAVERVWQTNNQSRKKRNSLRGQQNHNARPLSMQLTILRSGPRVMLPAEQNLLREGEKAMG